MNLRTTLLSHCAKDDICAALLRVPKILLLRLSESTKYVCTYVRNSTYI